MNQIIVRINIYIKEFYAVKEKVLYQHTMADGKIWNINLCFCKTLIRIVIIHTSAIFIFFYCQLVSVCNVALV